MNIIIVGDDEEFSIDVDNNYLNSTLYDIFIKEKLLFIDTLYDSEQNIIPMKLPLKHFNSNKIKLFTQYGLYSLVRYRRYKKIIV